MSITIFFIIFLNPHLLSENKQLMPCVYPLSPICYLQPSLNLFDSRPPFSEIGDFEEIIPKNLLIQGGTCMLSSLPPRWTKTHPGGGFFRVLWSAVADMMRSQKPPEEEEEEARWRPSLVLYYRLATLCCSDSGPNSRSYGSLFSLSRCSAQCISVYLFFSEMNKTLCKVYLNRMAKWLHIRLYKIRSNTFYKDFSREEIFFPLFISCCFSLTPEHI